MASTALHRLVAARRPFPAGAFRRFSVAAVQEGVPACSSSPRQLSLDEVVSFCKRRGFIFPGSDLYGSIGTGYDYGPLGAALKKNIQDAWWRDFIERRPDCVPLESALLMNPRVWQASGHVQQFVDPLTECASCKKRTRADKLVKSAVEGLLSKGQGDRVPANLHDPATLGSLGLVELGDAISSIGIACPSCGTKGSAGLGSPRTFNLLFQTHVGPVLPQDHLGANPATGEPAAGQGAKGSPRANPNNTSISYLRPETAQGVYVNFANVLSSLRRKLPLGVGQVGKSFRNEIAVGNFIFRTREFDQMELQYFCDPADSGKHFDYWVGTCESWLQGMGMNPANFRRKEYGPRELAHYALATTDLEYRYPFGWEELWGIANRGDFDLKAHSAASGTDLMYRDTSINGSKAFFPHAVEPAVGVNRLMLAFLCDGLQEERVPGGSGDDGGTRTVLRLHDRLAPYKAAVLPVVKKEPLTKLGEDLHARMLQHLPVEYDVTQSVGKRYRRQDEIGTPLCITVDNQSTSDGTVTVRDRDSMAQVRLHVDDIVARCETGRFSRQALAGTFEAARTAGTGSA